jgi:arylsulfatase A-like enzyme
MASVCDRPNVLVILVDDLGYSDMSYKKDALDDICTPNIDRLARAGVSFEKAYATAPICSPARAGLISGQYQQRWGNYWYAEGGLPRFVRTMPEIFRAAGYRTAKIGKTHLNGGQKEHPLDHGFDDFLGFIHHTWDYTRLSRADVEAFESRRPGSAMSATIGPLMRNREDVAEYENGFTTDIFTDEALNIITDKEANKPFFLWLSYNAVHHPTYITSKKYADIVGLIQPIWDRDKEDWEFPYWDPSKEPWREWHAKWGHMGRVDSQGRLRYLSQLVALDNGIGRILDELHLQGLEENTIIVFLSDNGGSPNTYAVNYPLSGYKYMFAEGGLRIPMIISWPGKLSGGHHSNLIVSAMDIFPTLTELAGLNVDLKFDGVSLVSQLTGEADENESVHDYLFWSDGQYFSSTAESDGFWVVRQGSWKLVRSPGWTHPKVRFEGKMSLHDGEYRFPSGLLLFNLDDDPSETQNLSTEYPEIVSELSAAFGAWGTQVIAPVRGDDRITLTENMLK